MRSQSPLWAKPVSALGVCATHPLTHVYHVPFNSPMLQIINAQPLSTLLKAAAPEWQGQVPLDFTCSAQAAPHQLSESGQALPCFHGFKKPDPACSQTDRHLICARKPINIDCRVPRLLARGMVASLLSGAVFSLGPPASLRIPQSQMTALPLIVPRRSRPLWSREHHSCCENH